MLSKRTIWIMVAVVAGLGIWYLYTMMPNPTPTHGQPITYPGSNPANPGGVGYNVLNG
jgi:uncharacterized membrane protein